MGEPGTAWALGWALGWSWAACCPLCTTKWRVCVAWLLAAGRCGFQESLNTRRNASVPGWPRAALTSRMPAVDTSSLFFMLMGCEAAHWKTKTKTQIMGPKNRKLKVRSKLKNFCCCHGVALPLLKKKSLSFEPMTVTRIYCNDQTTHLSWIVGSNKVF